MHAAGAITPLRRDFLLAIRTGIGYNKQVAPAGVMELVDVVDSKSTAGDSVPVRVRSPAPKKRRHTDVCLLFFGVQSFFSRGAQTFRS